jgi:transcriptional regulator EpsA
MEVAQSIIEQKSDVNADIFRSDLQATPEESKILNLDLKNNDFFDVISSSLKINTPHDFRMWAQSDLQLIFPHGMLVCGIGQLEPQGAFIQHLLTSNFPFEYMQTLQDIGGMGASPVFLNWLETRRPVLFEMSTQSRKTAWMEHFKKHNLQNMASHGLSDLDSHSTSYFGFCRIPGKLTTHHANLLEMLVPLLHVALIRAFKGVKNASSNASSSEKIAGLSKRELEILHCLCAGKTNLEIAQQLYISEFTVKNHVKNVLLKLNVNTRAQAVAKTSRQELLEVDRINAADLTLQSMKLPKHITVRV